MVTKIRELEHMIHENCAVLKRQLRRHLQTPNGRLYRKQLSEIHSERREKLKHRKFQLYHGRKMFSATVVKYWNRLPRGCVKSPSLGDI